jgi:hypothetical protein
MRAWLVTWEWMSDSAIVFDRIAAIFNPRMSSPRVAEYVEFLYSQATSSVSELAVYAKRRKNNPFPAEVDVSGHIRCGHHPWLHAQGVKDLNVTHDAITGLETVSWHTLPVYRPGPNLSRITVSSGQAESYSRQVLGPLSTELAWDRMAGALKPTFKPYAF